MTTIVGWADGTTIIMAADGLTTCGNEILTRDALKILRLPLWSRDPDAPPDDFLRRLPTPPVPAGHVLVGVAGSRALQDEIEHQVAAHKVAGEFLPILDTPDAPPVIWVHQFVRAVHRCANASPFPHAGTDRGVDGTLLIGVRGTLWLATNDGTITLAAHGYQAIGSGASYALGALRQAMTDPQVDPAIAVQDAVAAAATFDVWTGGDIHVHIERPDGTADES